MVAIPGAGPGPRLLIAWPSPAAYADGEAALEVAAEYLGGGPRPHLALLLAQPPGPATHLDVRQVGLAQAGQFEVAVQLTSPAMAGEATARIERAVDDVRAGRIDAEALAGARNRLRTRRLAELDSLAARAERVARYRVLAGDPDFLQRDLDRLAAVDPATLQAVVRARLRHEDRVLVTAGLEDPKRPAGASPPAAPGVTRRSTIPPASRTTDDHPRWHRPPAAAPASAPRPRIVRRLRLPGGLPVWLLAAPRSSTVRLDLVIHAGSGDDPPGQPGLARHTARLLRGAGGAADAADDQLARLGAWTDAAVDSERSRFSLQVARAQLDRALALWASSLAASRLSGTPQPAAPAPARPPGPAAVISPDQTLAVLMFGEAHPYVRALQPAVVPPPETASRAFFARHYHRANATLVVSGHLDPSQLRRLEGLLAARPGRAAGGLTGAPGPRVRAATPRRRPAGRTGTGAPPVRPRIVLLDRPGAATAEVRLGAAGVPRRSPQYATMAVTSELLGGPFGRLDRRLRLERPLALALRSTVDARRTGGLWVIQASFPVEDTLVGLRELLAALEALAAGEATAWEVTRARQVLIRRLATRVGALSEHAAALTELASLGLAPPALDSGGLPRELARVDTEAVRKLARAHLLPEHLAIVITGDRKQLEDPLRDLGDVEVRTAAGPATASAATRTPARATR